MIRLNTNAGKKMAKFAYSSRLQCKTFVDSLVLHEANFDVGKFLNSKMAYQVAEIIIKEDKIQKEVKETRENFYEGQIVIGSVYVFSPKELQHLLSQFEQEIVKEVRGDIMQWGEGEHYD